MHYKKQQKYFEILKKYEKKMNDKELQKYKMFLKRHKDDEDLDKISLEFLDDLYEKYYLNRERKNFDQFFKNTEKTE